MSCLTWGGFAPAGRQGVPHAPLWGTGMGRPTRMMLPTRRGQRPPPRAQLTPDVLASVCPFLGVTDVRGTPLLSALVPLSAQVLDGCGWWYAIMLAQSHPIIRPLVAVVPRAGSVFSTLFCLDFLIFKFTRLCAVRFGPNFSDFLGVCVSFSFLYFFSFLGWVFCVSRRFGQ